VELIIHEIEAKIDQATHRAPQAMPASPVDVICN
jgi:hypothetical protein